MSKAHSAFIANAGDVERLLAIHKDLGGDQQGRRFRLEVLNKSAIVLITAIWEAYCEDIAREALEHLVNHLKDSDRLPKQLKQEVAAELKGDPNQIAVWALADSGWRVLLQARLSNLRKAIAWGWNTPKSANVDQLFLKVLGLSDVSSCWYWPGMSKESARKKLDGYVALRGDIAHRGKAAQSCKKVQVTDYFNHVRSLVGVTDASVRQFVGGLTAMPFT